MNDKITSNWPAIPLDIGRKLNVRRKFRRRPGGLLNVLCMANFRPLFKGEGGHLKNAHKMVIETAHNITMYSLNTTITYNSKNMIFINRKTTKPTYFRLW